MLNEVADALPTDQASLRLRIDLAYDGTQFRGWAAQPGLRTCQGVVEQALSMVARRTVSVTVAGRTDAGVHARHQVIHVDFPAEAWAGLVRESGVPAGEKAESALTADDLRAEALVRRLNGLIARAYGDWARDHAVAAPKGTSDLVIHSAQRVSADFDARFAATGRSYCYRIGTGVTADPLRRADVLWVPGLVDASAMNRAAKALLGEHDFLSYCRPREGATTIRTLRRLDVVVSLGGIVEFHVAADAFCHSMVRSLVGALLEVGLGRRGEGWPGELLASRSRDSAAPIAPAHGLTLESVEYPAPGEWAARVTQARRRRDEPGGCC